MDFQTLQYEQDGPVGVLTLNRPECLNAINSVLRDELHAFLQARLTDHDTRVLVVTGAGRGFCAGLDIKDPEMVNPAGEYTAELAYRLQRLFSEFILLLRRIPQPIVAAVNGAAAGAGLSIAMASDIRLAAPAARFSAAYINIGVGGADMGSSWLLPRLVGLGNAARYLYTGDLFDAAEALRIGLVQEVLEPDDLLDRARTLALQIASKSPLGLRLTKEALDQNAGGVSLEEAVKLEDRNQALCIAQLSSLLHD